MLNDLQPQYRASYRRMEDGTKEEYHRVFELLKKFELYLADRVLGALELLKNSYPGETVNRYPITDLVTPRRHVAVVPTVLQKSVEDGR